MREPDWTQTQRQTEQVYVQVCVPVTSVSRGYSHPCITRFYWCSGLCNGNSELWLPACWRTVFLTVHSLSLVKTACCWSFCILPADSNVAAIWADKFQSQTLWILSFDISLFSWDPCKSLGFLLKYKNTIYWSISSTWRLHVLWKKAFKNNKRKDW